MVIDKMWEFGKQQIGFTLTFGVQLLFRWGHRDFPLAPNTGDYPWPPIIPDDARQHPQS